MIKEAIEYLIKLKRPEMINDDTGFQHILRDSYSEINLKKHQCVNISTLNGLFDLLESESKREVLIISKCTSMIIIADYNKINVISKDYLPDMSREKYIDVNARKNQVSFDYDDYLDIEDFRIKLSTYFANTGDKDILIESISKIESSHVKISDDDGISQEVIMKDGIARKSTAVLPKYVSLAPFRSFTEIDPTEEDFLFRVRKGGDGEIECALFRTGSNQWRLELCKKIKVWLKKRLPGWDIIE